MNLPLVANLAAKSSVRCDFRLEYAVGEVAEWSKAAVLKTVDGQPSGGSNPSLSASFFDELWFNVVLERVCCA